MDLTAFIRINDRFAVAHEDSVHHRVIKYTNAIQIRVLMEALVFQIQKTDFKNANVYQGIGRSWKLLKIKIARKNK